VRLPQRLALHQQMLVGVRIYLSLERGKSSLRGLIPFRSGPEGD